MTDVHLPPPNEQASTPAMSSGLGWPSSHGLDTTIDVSRETSMERAGLGWPE